jgi:hypothetical protein
VQLRQAGVAAFAVELDLEQTKLGSVKATALLSMYVCHLV